LLFDTTSETAPTINCQRCKHQSWCHTDKRIQAGGHGYTQELKVFDTRTGSNLVTIQGSTVGGINKAVFRADGLFILTANGNGTVTFRDAGTGQENYTFVGGHSGAVNDVAITRNMDRIVSAGENGELILWDAPTGQQISSWV
jgi:WD40 repeat protein